MIRKSEDRFPEKIVMLHQESGMDARYFPCALKVRR